MDRAGLVGIRSIRVHPGPPGGDPEILRLVIRLEPKPPSSEEWWWRRRLGGVGVLREDALEIQLDVVRSGLEEAVRKFRAAVIAANVDYPKQYALDADAQEKAEDGERIARETRLRDDQAIVDRVLREDPPAY